MKQNKHRKWKWKHGKWVRVFHDHKEKEEFWAERKKWNESVKAEQDRMNEFDYAVSKDK